MISLDVLPTMIHRMSVRLIVNLPTVIWPNVCSTNQPVPKRAFIANLTKPDPQPPQSMFPLPNPVLAGHANPSPQSLNLRGHVSTPYPCVLWFGFGFGKFPPKIPNFLIFPFGSKKSLRV